LVDLGDVAGVKLAKGWMGLPVLVWAVGISLLYGGSSRLGRIDENVLKAIVWLVVLCFAIVVVWTGVDWGAAARGFFTFRIPAEKNGIAGFTVVLATMAAAVGINMVFLYPYSLLRKGWGPKHKELAYFDLVSGMVVPFLIATTFLIVATAATIGPGPGGTGREVLNILELVPVLGTTFGEGLALALIGAGMLAVGVSTIITHMLASGFIGCEIFGYPHDSLAKWWFSFLPAVGLLGVAYPFPWAMSVTASTRAYPLMPVAVICFVVLLNRKDYMGAERPEGGARLLWNLGLGFAVLFMAGAAWLALRQNWADFTAVLSASS
jgi:Mn2+/Fe2+ NRAMP family transporter